MHTFGTAGLLLVFTLLALACPLHGADEHESTSTPVRAEGSFFTALHASTSMQPVILCSTQVLAIGTGIIRRIAVLPSWILVRSIEHAPR